MKRCKYCNKKIDSESNCCSDYCKEKVDKYFGKWKKYKIIFSIIVIASLILIIGQAVLFPQNSIVSKFLIIIMGSTLFILPFGNTVDSLGVRKTVIIIRVLAIFLILLTTAIIIFKL